MMLSKSTQNKQTVNRNTIIVIALVLANLFYTSFVFADPGAPTAITVVSSQSRTISGGNKTTIALAGNVTELNIEGLAVVTSGWQGYFGNISGEIVLDDANNNSFYAWSVIAPGGEIIASRNHSVDWSAGNILCPNMTQINNENTLIFPGSNKGNSDNITNTFNYTTHPSFTLGSNSFIADQCNYSASTWVDNTQDAARTFNETLLYSNQTNNILYVALINNNANGFKVGSEKYDFQMLVGEDGHDNSQLSTYYFYVELAAS